MALSAWKDRLYQAYVSTGQAPAPHGAAAKLAVANYPQLVGLIRRHVAADTSLRIVDLGCGPRGSAAAAVA